MAVKTAESMADSAILDGGMAERNPTAEFPEAKGASVEKGRGQCGEWIRRGV